MKKCSVCTHPEVDAINQALIDGVSYRDISRQFSVSKDSLHRHRLAHLPNALIKAAEADQVLSADALLARIKELHAKTLTILDRNIGKDDRIALSAIKEARGNLDLIGRLLGELDTSPKVAVLVTSPEWIELRTAILLALEPYPEARQAVVNGLRELSA